MIAALAPLAFYIAGAIAALALVDAGLKARKAWRALMNERQSHADFDE